MEEPLKIYRHQLEEMLEEARIEGRSRKMEDRERIAEFHCQECGQYLPTPLTQHTYKDCRAYKVKVLKELDYAR